MDRQDRELRRMQPQQADTASQIQAMRQEINELKGQLDDLKNGGGAKAVADKMSQNDSALGQVDNNMALNPDLGKPLAKGTASAPAVPTTGFGGVGAHAPDSSAYGAASTVPSIAPAPAATEPSTGNYGLGPSTAVPATAAAVPEGYEVVTAPSESTWGKADPRPEVATPKKDISLALFDAGVNSFNARNYGAAEKSFTDFVNNYPDHSQTAEARFYLAECQFARNRFPEAALAYDTVIKKYPKSDSAPGAYLKQAICFSKMNQGAAAQARMREIISKFPNSPEAARAKTFLKTNK